MRKRSLSIKSGPPRGDEVRVQRVTRIARQIRQGAYSVSGRAIAKKLLRCYG